MKDSAWYNKLWQTKMQELPLQGDEHDAWQKMQGLLDYHMPVNSTAIAPKAGTSLWVKLMYVLATIISVAILYYAANHMLVHHHEKIKKTTHKHVRATTYGTVNKSYLTITAPRVDNVVDGKKIIASSNTNKNNGVQNTLNVSERTDKTSLANKTNINKADIKHTTGNYYISHSNSLAISNLISSDSHIRRTRTVNNMASRKNISTLTNSLIGLYNPKSQKKRLHLRSRNYFLSEITNKNIFTSTRNQQSSADQSLVKTNGVILSNTGGAVVATSTNGVTQNVSPINLSVRKDSLVTKSDAKKQRAAAKVGNQTNKSGSKSKSSVSKKITDPKFMIDIKLGANINKEPHLNPFLAIMGNYHFQGRWGISVGTNILSTRIISGSYERSNLNYITIGDSSKKITHNSGKVSISSTRKIVYIDVPVLVTYKLSNRFIITAGPVISIPIKAGANKNTLGPLSSSADTTTLRTIKPYVSNTTINNKINFSFSAGARYNIKRFYFDATYLQGLSPYVVGSDLGSAKIYYRTIQIGIGYHLFKSKSQ